MVRINDTYLKNFCKNNNYDIRQLRNGRWMDQKVTPDVLAIVSDIIVQFCEDNDDYLSEFTSKDIWFSQYALETVPDVFDKTSPENEGATAEYNKFFQQPMKMLAYAGVLEERNSGRMNYFKVMEPKILEYIAMGETKSLKFLQTYIESVLTDSGIMPVFLQFFDNQNETFFKRMKDDFVKFMIKNTDIEKPLEPRRIFTKVLNPLANKYKSRGTNRGYLSKKPIEYSELMYNQANFRDLNKEKPKGKTRAEWQLYLEKADKQKNAYTTYSVTKAKNLVRRFNQDLNDGLSELPKHGPDLAIHMHHIFPQHEFEALAAVPENIIALTPTEHFNNAHNNGNTRSIDVEFQKDLLLAKLETVKKDKDEELYSFNQLVKVIQTGCGDENFRPEENDFDAVQSYIEKYYENIW